MSPKVYKPNSIRTPLYFDIDYGCLTYHLHKEGLKKYTGWPSGVKEYLNTEKTISIDILEIVTQYRDLVISFQHWFNEQENLIHKKGFQELQEKEAELFCRELEVRIERYYKEKEFIRALENNFFPSY